MTGQRPPALEQTYAEELSGLYEDWVPKGFPEPSLLLVNEPLARDLNIDSAWLKTEGAAIFSGTQMLAGTRPLAQAYAGHQFGQFNPQLGDGRAVLLGELVDGDGRRFDVQLKGSGTTPFSRRGDGRAALDSVLREYLLSEAMSALDIPTTRALAVVTTGETVTRDRRAPGAVLTRVASSHIRVGTLELFSAQGEPEKLRRLVDYTLRRHYPESADAPNKAKALLDAVAAAQARLIAKWMLVGFVHGVMNTDNVALSGETIDFGPCAFMDTYDPKTVFSRIDQFGRYAYGNQPQIGGWNLARMAEALLELLADDPAEAVSLAEGALEVYNATLQDTWARGMAAKLGIDEPKAGDADLAQALLEWMLEAKADYTQTFRRLSASLVAGESAFADDAFLAWEIRWRARLGGASLQSVAERMEAVNPVYIARNHKVEEALDAAVAGDLEPTRALLEVLSAPFQVQAGREAYAEPAPPEFGPYQTHCNT